MSKSYKTTREKLYNEIWQMTVTHYCHKYNVSYKELKKCCEENDIPMPTALYWRELKSGGNPKILPLPPSDIIDIEIPCIQTQRKYFDLTSKANTVCVLKILEKYSDEKKPLSVRKIIELMERDYMLSVSRATVYDSLEILNKLGYDISTYSENSKGYYLRYRKFNTYEIQTIIDSVAINPMVPTKIEKEIQFKIKKEMGYPNYKSYREIHGVDKRNKMYQRFYYNLEQIDYAIINDKKISFEYGRYNTSGELISTNGKIIMLTPERVVFEKNNYFLRCIAENGKDAICYKINKMLNISVLEMPADRCPENFEKIYSSDKNVVFFSQDCFIKIKCNIKILEDAMEFFGYESEIKKDAETSFLLTRRFDYEYAKLFSLNHLNYCEVLEPVELRDEIIAIIRHNTYCL